MNYKFIDLFSGLGGFRLAFENLGCECVFSSEIDKYARDTYYNNFNQYPSGDITKIDASEIPDHDILCGGFPCQAFSIGGKRLGFEDSRGTLFFDVARILKEKQPKAFILENVKGLVSHDKGNTLKTITNILGDIGYTFDYRVMNALDYGVPQNRERWYCIGFRKDLDISFTNEDEKINYIFPDKTDLLFTIEDVIKEGIVGYEITDRALENINLHLPKYACSKGIDKDKLLIANEIRPSRCSFKNDGTVPCFTAKMGTGGNNIPVVVNYGRKLTEKECLKLMGFPDDYKIQAKTQQTYKQIGNSVVVTIIQLLGNELVQILNQIDKICQKNPST